MSVRIFNQIAEGWFAWVWHAGIQASIVVVIVLVTVRWMKYLPANFKYALLLLAMVKFLTPPFYDMPTGMFSLFAAPSAVVLNSSVEPLPPSESLTKNDDSQIDKAERPDSFQVKSDSVVDFTQELKALEASTLADATSGRTTSDLMSTDSATESVLPQYINPSAWLMVCWLAGASVLAVRMFLGWICLLRVMNRCEVADCDRQNEFSLLAKSMGVRRTQLLLSSAPVSPMACGLFRPVVIVPQALVKKFSPDEQRAVFAHELAHHRRFDPLLLWIQWGFVAIWWFHPLAWILNRMILRVREQCCDDMVIIKKLVSRDTYGAALLRTAEWCSTRMRLLEYAAPQMSSLKDRIVKLIDPETRRAAKLSAGNWSFVALTALVALPGFGTNTPNATVSLQAQSGGNVAEDSPHGKANGFLGGRVLNEQGQPIMAKVWLRSGNSSNNFNNTSFRHCETDSEGRYQFENVTPGWINVAACGEGYSHTGVLFTLVPGRIEKNLNLLATPPTTLNLNVRNEQGEPVIGAELYSIQWQTQGNHLGLYPDLMKAQGIEIPKSDTEGRLSFPCLPKGVACTVYLRHPDYVSQKLENLPVDREATATLKSGYPVVINAINAETSEPVSDATVSISGIAPDSIRDALVSADGTYRTRFPMQTEYLTITVNHPELMADEVKRQYRDGLVHYDAKLYRPGLIHGRVINQSTGEPVSGIPVYVTKHSGLVARAVSGPDGKFEARIPAGSYFRVSVQGGGGFYSGVYTEPTEGKDSSFDRVITPLPPVDVKVMPGETFVLPDLMINRLPKIKGVVVMPDGQPADGILVHNDTWRPASQRTDIRGRFEFDGQEPSDIHVEAYHLTQPLFADAALSVKDWFAGKDLEIRLEPAVNLAGKVLDQNEKPMAGVNVWLVSSMRTGPPNTVGTSYTHSREASSSTDENGDFEFSGLSRQKGYLAVAGEPFEESSPKSNWLEPPFAVTQFEPIRLKGSPPPAVTQTVSRDAPQLQCRQWLNSNAISIEAARGKVLVIQFLDSVSSESVNQLQALQELHDLYQDRGCIVVALFHSSVSVADAEAISGTHKFSFPMGFDDDAGQTFNSYHIIYAPRTILIGRDGRITFARGAADEMLIRVRELIVGAKSEE